MTPIGQLLVGVLPKGLRVPHRIPHEKGSGFGVWDVQDLFGEKGPGLWKVVFDSNVGFRYGIWRSGTGFLSGKRCAHTAYGSIFQSYVLTFTHACIQVCVHGCMNV